MLHVTPESAIGGPLAYVRNGDRIRLSVSRREICAAGVATRSWRGAPQRRRSLPPTAERGYRKLFLQTVTQADQGVDFDFLRAPNTVGRIPR